MRIDERESLERIERVRQCQKVAESLREALDLCDSKADLRSVLADFGFQLRRFASVDSGLEARRDEYVADVVDRAQAWTISPSFGIVCVRDYSMAYVDTVQVLSAHAQRLLLSVWTDQI